MRFIRTELRGEQHPTAKFIDKTGDVYRPVPGLFDVDVWDSDRLLQQAAARRVSAEALSEALVLYRDDLLEAVYYEWADPLKDQFRSRFLDAVVHLSNLHVERGEHEEAVNALLRGISADPYAEHLYRCVHELFEDQARRTHDAVAVVFGDH